MKKFDKVKEYIKEYECEILLGASFACYGAAIGIVVGDKIATKRISKGLKKCFDVDPSFEEHFVCTVIRAFKADCLR